MYDSIEAETTTRKVVTAAHGHARLRRNHQYVAKLLGRRIRNRLSDRGRSGLMKREGADAGTLCDGEGEWATGTQLTG
ncbi:hypothetical protein EVAR_18347_1 [Eumeta japonica]|uniref:Uncharacterized protein n=1 Tax=Eumeta variegata TaxID=151549 RepID=A0A4C1V8M2_EUMVA|nr:hypothetical protein EVAR_18347_1 [Eumeta japonica]